MICAILVLKFTKIKMVSPLAPIGGGSLFFLIFKGEKLLQKAGKWRPENHWPFALKKLQIRAIFANMTLTYLIKTLLIFVA